MLGSDSNRYRVPTICKYRCERVLKASDTCTTLLVRCASTHQLMVMKRSATAAASSRQLVAQEADILRRASAAAHPNIVRLCETFEDECGRAVLVTEWCEGGDLSDWIRTATESERHSRLPMLFRQLASALDHLHSLGILHRDLKPRNVFVQGDGASLHAKVGDFGVSKEGGLGETALGTPLYLCPEIVRGRPYSFPSDIWALGCVMYEVAKGAPPFPGKNLREVLVAIARRDPQPISDGGADWGPSGALIMRCLRKEEGERITAAQLVRELDGAAATTTATATAKRREGLERADCLRLLLDKFGSETAYGIVECLQGHDERTGGCFARARDATFEVPEGPKAIHRLIKLRQLLCSVLHEDLLEQAIELMKRRDCREADFVALLGREKHDEVVANDIFMPLKELCLLEGCLTFTKQ